MRTLRPHLRGIGTTLTAVLATATAAVATTASTTPTPEPSPTPTLADVARDRELDSSGAARDDAGRVVITDENLSRLATQGGLTESTATPPATAPEMGDEIPSSRSRAAWREVYRRQRELVRELEVAIAELDERIPRLWSRFYAEDDPHHRDGVIKVELDRALRRRDELERSLHEERPKLMEILEAARRAGAPPGWLRDLVE